MQNVGATVIAKMTSSLPTEVNLLDLYGRRVEWTPRSCPLTSTCLPMCCGTHTSQQPTH